MCFFLSSLSSSLAIANLYDSFSWQTTVTFLADEVDVCTYNRLSFYFDP
jgi:hypothetical protein